MVPKMKRVARLLAAIAFLAPVAAFGQVPGGDELAINKTPIIGGTTGRCLYDNSGKVGEQVCAGAPTGAAGGDLTGTYPNPTLGSGSASVLNAGTLAAARGGAGTITGALKGNGAGVVSQAACADVSNAAASCSTDATNASNIGSGTLPTARLSTTGVPAQIGAFAKINVQTFCSSGCTTTISGGSTGTYTPSTGLLYAVLECGGAGGGGGGAASAAGTIGNGAGGGAGSRSVGFASAATIGASQVVSIGTLGTAGASGNNAGGAGGDSSVGSLVVGKGGAGGAGSSGAAASAGGAGGVIGTGNTLTSTGQPGGTGFFASIFTVTVIAGMGGSSVYGGGGVTGTGNPQTGSAGLGHSSGGSGGWAAAGVSAAGGAGTTGFCSATEFLNQ
jgi:hypothetical protein